MFRLGILIHLLVVYLLAFVGPRESRAQGLAFVKSHYTKVRILHCDARRQKTVHVGLRAQR